MKHVSSLLAICILILIPTIASAQATRTWVSGVGDDANPCSRTAPCKTWAGAISKTATNGEINVLDPGGFGGVTITKSITLDGGYTMASILAAGTNGIIINPTNTSTVTIRNLHINGVTTGTNGIRILNGKNIHIENVKIFGFRSSTGRAIDINTSVSQARVLLKDVSIHDNLVGVFSTVGVGGSVNMTIDHCKISQHTTGVDLAASTRVSISDSDISQNVTGLNIQLNNSDADITRTTMNSNSTAAINMVNAGTTVRIYGNQFTKNGNSFVIPGGATVSSHGENVIAANGTNTLPNATPGSN